jgi:hypothetical protein
MLKEHGGVKCVADLLLVTFLLYAAAALVLVGSTYTNNMSGIGGMMKHDLMHACKI